MNISDRIQALRKARGITQEQLADAVGVSRQAVSKWEAEQSAPDLERIVAMAEYFDVTTDYLLRGIEPAPAAQPKARASARTMCIIATALDAAGVILGGAFWREYQNWLCIAVMLIFQVVAVTVWLLTRGDRPRWFWAVNIWMLGILPASALGSLLESISSFIHYPAIQFVGLICYFAPYVLWLLLGVLVTWLTLRRKNK